MKGKFVDCPKCGGKWQAPRCGLEGGSKNCDQGHCKCDMDGDCPNITSRDCTHCIDGKVEHFVGVGWCIVTQKNCEFSEGHGANGMVRCACEEICPHQDIIDEGVKP